MTVCRSCNTEFIACASCKRQICKKCDPPDHVDTPVLKGWTCHPCLGSDTEAHTKPKKLSSEHGSPDKLILKYAQRTLFQLATCFHLSLEIDNRENPAILHADVLNSRELPTLFAQPVQLYLHIINNWLAGSAHSARVYPSLNWSHPVFPFRHKQHQTRLLSINTFKRLLIN